MNLNAIRAAEILRANPDAISCRPETNTPNPRFRLTFPDLTHTPQIHTPPHLETVPLELTTEEPFKILRLPTDDAHAETTNEMCQNEPISMGCQVQPDAADWVGTAGAPIRWLDRRGRTHWGLLSNWHVLADGLESAGRPIYQPTDHYSAMAALSAWNPVTPEKTNLLDAAVADSFIAGFHTTAFDLLEIGIFDPVPLNAAPELPVKKVGRTTRLTDGLCTATGVAARVGYGAFTALFADQDQFRGADQQFSAPGDSGSLIVCQLRSRPCSLLFAGNSTTTLGNPIRYAVKAFDLRFNE